MVHGDHHRENFGQSLRSAVEVRLAKKKSSLSVHTKSFSKRKVTVQTTDFTYSLWIMSTTFIMPDQVLGHLNNMKHSPTYINFKHDQRIVGWYSCRNGSESGFGPEGCGFESHRILSFLPLIFTPSTPVQQLFHF
jgi:hypothetical protein